MSPHFPAVSSGFAPSEFAQLFEGLSCLFERLIGQGLLLHYSSADEKWYWSWPFYGMGSGQACASSSEAFLDALYFRLHLVSSATPLCFLDWFDKLNLQAASADWVSQIR